MSLADLSRRVRVLGDPLRIRILSLLASEELAVSELVRILNSGQSRVSSHLAKLAEEELVFSRREGRFLLYRARLGEDAAEDGWPAMARAVLEGFRSTSEATQDRDRLAHALKERDTGSPPDSMGKHYLPGRTWEGMSKALLQLLVPRRIADFGIGRGDLTLMLAEKAQTVIAVDLDAQRLAAAKGRAEALGLAHKISFREGDLQDPPIAIDEVDCWWLSQVLHLVAQPELAIAAAFEKLERGGTIIILDLLDHQETWVQERLGHRHLGFSQVALRGLLESAGFVDVDVRRAARDRKPPHFVSVLASGRKPS